MPFVITIASNAIGLLLAVYLLPRFIPGSIEFTGSFIELLIAGAVIGLINAVLRPLLKLLSLPLMLLTAGLFGFIINIILLWLADLLLPSLDIHGLLPLAITTVILGIVHVIL